MRWISSMNRTSRGSRLVRIAARSPALARMGPEVARKPTPSSRATICASVVLPSPGGPNSRTWSSASERPRAASMKTFRLPFAADWPTNSDRVWGLRARSYCSPGAGAGEMMRSSVILPSPLRGEGGSRSETDEGEPGGKLNDGWKSARTQHPHPSASGAPLLPSREKEARGRPSSSQLLQGRADDQGQFGLLAQLDQGVIDGAAGIDLGDAQAQQGGDRLARDAGRRRGDGGFGVDAGRGRGEDAVGQALALQFGDDAQGQLGPHAVGAAHGGLVFARDGGGQLGGRQHVQHAQRRLRPHALNGLQEGEDLALVAGQETIEARPLILAPLAVNEQGGLVARRRQAAQRPRPAGRDITHPSAVDQAFRLADLGQNTPQTTDHAAPLTAIVLNRR